jgi:hypothetical protein
VSGEVDLQETVEGRFVGVSEVVVGAFDVGLEESIGAAIEEFGEGNS